MDGTLQRHGAATLPARAPAIAVLALLTLAVLFGSLLAARAIGGTGFGGPPAVAAHEAPPPASRPLILPEARPATGSLPPAVPSAGAAHSVPGAQKIGAKS